MPEEVAPWRWTNEGCRCRGNIDPSGYVEQDARFHWVVVAASRDDRLVHATSTRSWRQTRASSSLATPKLSTMLGSTTQVPPPARDQHRRRIANTTLQSPMRP